MAYIKCSLNPNDKSVKDFNADTKKIIFGARTLIMNAMEQKKEKANYPKNTFGFTGVPTLTAQQIMKLSEEVNVGFAKAALKHCSAKEFYNTEDIAQLAEPMVHNDEGVQRFVMNAISAILTATFPAVQSNIFNFLVETRYAGIGDTLEFDIPSNEVYLWNKGARGSRSFGHDERFANTLVLNPKPVGTTYDVPWIRIAKSEYDFGDDMLAAMLGWDAYTMGIFAQRLAAGVSGLQGTALYAPTFSHANFVKIKNNVKKYNGNQGMVWCFGTEVPLSKILPAQNEMLFGVSEEWVKMGMLSQYARTPLIEILDSFVPGTYAGNNPVDVMGDKMIYFFASGATQPIKQGIGGNMVTVGRNQAQKSNKVTSFTIEVEHDMEIITGNRWGAINVV